MTASFMEVLQVVAAATGVFFAWLELDEADKELTAVKESKYDGDRSRIACKNIRVARCILLFQCVLFTIGLWTCFSPPPPLLPLPLIDPSGVLTPEMITWIVIGNRHAVIAKQVSMMSGSVIFAWLSYRNKMTMGPVRRRTRSTDPEEER